MNKLIQTGINSLKMTMNLRWNRSPVEILKRGDELIIESKTVYDRIASVCKDEITYVSVIKVLTSHDRYYSTERHQLDFLQQVSPVQEIRDASVTTKKKMSEFDVEISMRQDVFDVLLATEEKIGNTLDYESKRYLEKLVKLGKRNGLHLDKNVQDQIKSIKKRTSEIGIDFQTNISNDNQKFHFSADELEGCPETFINSLEKSDDGKYIVNLDYPCYFPCMKYARIPKTREILERAFHSRAKVSNGPLLEELADLRRKQAGLLGYETHADFILELRMAKSKENVREFLDLLSAKLKPLQNEELKLFLEYKKTEHNKYGFDFDGNISMSDMRYYMTSVEEEKYSVDHNKLKEYFPVDVVTNGLLEIYQELLSLKFEKIENASAWCEEVTLYTVRDADDDQLMGYFYLDLYPRPNKFGHAACFTLQPGCLDDNGSRQVAVAAMVANFTKPVGDKPALLTHNEVVTFFHEFGHVMHSICAKADLCMFSGISCERDFVEAPSQMLENWCWEKESLKRLSKHYIDGSEIPDDIIDKLVASRQANTGVFNMRQIMLSTFDQNIHSFISDGDQTMKIDPAEIMIGLSKNILGIPFAEGTNMGASFGHLAGGYDAQYYGYMWSEVYSADMFMSRFKKEGIMNPQVGKDYRRYILQPGGSVDAFEMLNNFLGREPSQDAFLKMKGI